MWCVDNDCEVFDGVSCGNGAAAGVDERDGFVVGNVNDNEADNSGAGDVSVGCGCDGAGGAKGNGNGHGYVMVAVVVMVGTRFLFAKHPSSQLSVNKNIDEYFVVSNMPRQISFNVTTGKGEIRLQV